MGRIVKLLITLAVLAAILVGLDRLALVVTDKAASRDISARSQIQGSVSVSFDGFPFVSQMIGGTYHDVHVTATSVTLQQLHDATLDAHLYDVSIPLGDLIHGSVKTIPVKRAAGYLLASYSELARLSGVDGLTMGESSGQLVVHAPVTVPLLGKVTVDARGSLTPSGNTLSLSLSQVSVNGIAISPEVANSFAGSLAKTITIPPLPYGLHVTSTQPTTSGLRIYGEGSNITLTKTN